MSVTTCNDMSSLSASLTAAGGKLVTFCAIRFKTWFSMWTSLARRRLREGWGVEIRAPPPAYSEYVLHYLLLGRDRCPRSMDYPPCLTLNTAILSTRQVLIDFYAVWCGPCRMIAPKVAEMAQEFPDVVFLKGIDLVEAVQHRLSAQSMNLAEAMAEAYLDYVDVDANPEAAEKYEIAAMPTFVFMKDSNIVGNVVGASETKIREMINTHK
ncbi:unnamed protein product [Discosporangium mesarthrocarpum]